MKFKNKFDEERFKECKKTLQHIVTEMDKVMQETHGIELIITATKSTPEEDLALKRVSKTHQEGRAVDIRNFHWQKETKLFFVQYISEKFGHYGAISSTSKKPTIVYDKAHGSGPHFHIQIQRGLE